MWLDSSKDSSFWIFKNFLKIRGSASISLPRTSAQVRPNLFAVVLHLQYFTLYKMDHTVLRATCSEVHPTKILIHVADISSIMFISQLRLGNGHVSSQL